MSKLAIMLFLTIYFIFNFRARFYAAEIASAIGYLHSLQIIYRFVFVILAFHQHQYFWRKESDVFVELLSIVNSRE